MTVAAGGQREAGRQEVLDRARDRVARAARAELAYDGRLTERTRADACEQAGVHPSAFRTLFPTDDDLLDRVNEQLVDECAGRLVVAVAAFRAPSDRGDAMRELADCLTRARPVERASLVIRAERRLAALRARGEEHPAVVAAERRFVTELAEVLVEALARVGRRFSWAPALAVRVILDTYERSFEAWLLRGRDESDFAESPYATRTLPSLLERVSEPAPR